MKRFNRLWALLLAFALLLTYMPAMAFAEDAEGVDSDALSSEQMAEEDGSQEAVAENPAGEASDTAAPEASAPEKKEEPSEVNAKSTAPKKSSGGAENVDLRGAEGEVTVTFDANGGYFEEWNEETECYEKVGQRSEPYNIGEQWLYPWTPDREGFKFAGWAKSKDGGDPVDFDNVYTLEGDETFYAQWEKLPWATFDANGGYFNEWNEETQDYDKVTDPYVAVTEIINGEYRVIPSADPSRDGYSFKGWSLSKTGPSTIEFYDENYNYNYPIAEDTTFYALWDEKDTAIFDANGGHFTDEAGGGTVFYEDANDGIVEGYYKPVHDEAFVFDGWSLTKGGAAVPLDENGWLDYQVKGNVTFYARWAPAWTVTFDANGGKYDDGNGTETTKLIYVSKTDNYLGSGTTYYEVENKLSYAGKVFSHWTDKNGKTVDFDEGVNITEDTTYTANWEDGCALTLDAGDETFEDYGESTVVKYYKKGSNIQIHSGYMVEGETFRSKTGKVVMGWKLDGNLIEKSEDYYIPINSAMTLEAVWGEEFRIGFNAGEGSFTDSGYDDSVVEGDCLLFYGTKEISVNGETAFTYNRIYREDQLMPPEGKIFEGWYYDSDLSDPVLLETPITTELYESKKTTDEYGNEKLILYAKYTDDFYEVTLDANGGYLYGVEDEEVPELNLVCPAGKALDLSRYVPSNDDGNSFLGWYLDEECTDKAAISDDGGFIPDGTVTLHAKWQEPLPDIDVSLDGETGRGFYLDGNYIVNTYIENYDDADLSGFVKEAYINVFDTSNGGGNDIDELEPVAVLKNDEGHKYCAWSISKERITLYGPAIDEALDGLDIDRNDFCLELRAEIRTQDGEIVDDDYSIIFAKEPYVDYGLDQIFAFYDDESAIDHKKDILLGTEEDDDGYPADKSRWGRSYSNASPDGEEVPYKLTKVESSDPSVIEVKTFTSQFYLDPVSLGTSVITFTYKDVDGNTVKESYEVNVLGNKYFVWIDDQDCYDEEEEMYVYKAVPGGTVTFKADGDRRDFSKYYKDGYTFRWSVADESFADLVDITSSGDINENAAVTVHPDVDVEQLEGGIRIKAEIVSDEDGKAKASVQALINVVDEYYEIGSLPEEDEYFHLKKGESFTFTPELRRYASDTVSLDGGYEVVTDKDMKVSFYNDYVDEDTPVITVTSGGEVIESGGMINGPVTVKKLRDNSCYIKIYVPKDAGDDEEYYDDDEDALVSEDLVLSEMYDISKLTPTKIKGFTDLVYYKGKAREHVKGDTYIIVKGEEGISYKFWGDEDNYDIKYSNNKKVGKATAKIVGKGCCYGTKSVPFNIIPQATSLSKVTGGSKSFTAVWKKQAVQTTGYEIQYALNSKFTSGKKSVKVTSNKTIKKTVKNLKAKKYYYVRIRTYKKIGTKYYYSKWSKYKKIKTK